MRILMQSLKDGTTYLETLPVPHPSAQQVLIKSTCSLVSPGTEKMLIQFGRSSALQKAQQQPDKLQQVFQKIKNEGLFSTLETVQNKLDQPIALGYSNVGIVEELGSAVHHLSKGDRVVSNGYHAEYALASKHLCCKIPDNVDDDTAAFAIIAAIGLQGVRLLQVELGEKIVVIGLGLIGILTCQILQANGCEVIGMDNNENALEKANLLGITTYHSGKISGSDMFQHVFGGIGADAVIITASAAAPLTNYAAEICRKRGRIVLVGVVSNELDRDLFYKKELRFQVACSYGPGRYDPVYEEQGVDYPIGFVRWTESRNIEAVLQLMSNGKISTKHLLYRQSEFDDVIENFYSKLDELKWGNLIKYHSTNHSFSSAIQLQTHLPKNTNSRNQTFGVIGSGNFATAVIFPQLKKNGAVVKSLVSKQNTSAKTARKYGINNISTKNELILSDQEINTVIICNRHAAHGPTVLDAINSGKRVFVEKPLCTNENDLAEIKNKISLGAEVIVGFNRRFSPHSSKMNRLLGNDRSGVAINYLINAGFIDPSHWIQDPEQGGGRLIGEVCHFVDLCNYFTQSKVVEVNAVNQGNNNSLSDILSIQLKYLNGAIASIQYFSNGSKKYPKEQLQVFDKGKVYQIDNFKTFSINGSSSPFQFLNQMDKGYRIQFSELTKENSPFFNHQYYQDVIHSTEVTFAIKKSLEQNTRIRITEM
ncbi:MAG: bi-domain-containing oxidoreductase [Saprospiraceae bacterium]|nr:bi-domain-containing oxidoreductase [Saprospiraceae bacterium]MBK7796185.1 bi-domain-containing oxidoreductase [Saprospiraceae bacterium]MBL0260432.1 bi-domain-containing oxidoreductase [Saprospiraceae bacterium]